MTNQLTPYRSAASIEPYKQEQIKYGLISCGTPFVALPAPKKIKPIKPHICLLPKPASKFWQWLTGVKPINQGDLWRCSCDVVYECNLYNQVHKCPERGLEIKICCHGCFSWCDFWKYSSPGAWTEAGGIE